jgi:hypothetical protein
MLASSGFHVDAVAQQPVLYDKAEFIETSSGNKVSRKSVLCGSQNIHLNGKVSLLLIAIVLLQYA